MLIKTNGMSVPRKNTNAKPACTLALCVGVCGVQEAAAHARASGVRLNHEIDDLCCFGNTVGRLGGGHFRKYADLANNNSIDFGDQDLARVHTAPRVEPLQIFLGHATAGWQSRVMLPAELLQLQQAFFDRASVCFGVKYSDAHTGFEDLTRLLEPHKSAVPNAEQNREGGKCQFSSSSHLSGNGIDVDALRWLFTALNVRNKMKFDREMGATPRHLTLRVNTLIASPWRVAKAVNKAEPSTPWRTRGAELLIPPR